MSIFRCTFLLCTSIYLYLKPTSSNEACEQDCIQQACRRNGRKRYLHPNKFIVYHTRSILRVRTLVAITVHPHDCTVGKSCNVLIYLFQCTLSLPEPKNMKWQAQRALRLHSLGHISSLKVDENRCRDSRF